MSEFRRPQSWGLVLPPLTLQALTPGFSVGFTPFTALQPSPAECQHPWSPSFLLCKLSHCPVQPSLPHRTARSHSLLDAIQITSELLHALGPQAHLRALWQLFYSQDAPKVVHFLHLPKQMESFANDLSAKNILLLVYSTAPANFHVSTSLSGRTSLTGWNHRSPHASPLTVLHPRQVTWPSLLRLLLQHGPSLNITATALILDHPHAWHKEGIREVANK